MARTPYDPMQVTLYYRGGRAWRLETHLHNSGILIIGNVREGRRRHIYYAITRRRFLRRLSLVPGVELLDAEKAWRRNRVPGGWGKRGPDQGYRYD